jgi:hypothetical protein
MKKLIILLSLVTSFTTLANCPDVNLYRDTQRIWEIPIENQGEMNTCYSHTLSTIYNLNQSSNADNLNVYWTGFIHKNRILHWSPKSMNYSLLQWAWSDVVKKGVCDINVVKANLDKVKNGVPYSDDQLMYLLSYYFKSKFFRGVRSERNYLRTLAALMKKLNKVPEGFERPWVLDEIHQILDPIRRNSSHKGFFEFLGQYVFKECKDNRHRPSGILNYTGRKMESNDWIADYVGKVLYANKPVGIGYCPKIVHAEDPATTKDITVMPRILKAASTRCGSHYATLVGSRPAGNSCEFLLRNTYSDDFWAHESIECWCLDKSTGQQRNCRKKDDQGKVKVLGCWMSKDKLMTNIYDVYNF